MAADLGVLSGWGGSEGPGLGSPATPRASVLGPALPSASAPDSKSQHFFPALQPPPPPLCARRAYSPGGSQEDTGQGRPPGLDGHGTRPAVVQAGGQRPSTRGWRPHRATVMSTGDRTEPGRGMRRPDGGPAAGVRRDRQLGASFQQGVSCIRSRAGVGLIHQGLRVEAEPGGLLAGSGLHLWMPRAGSGPVVPRGSCP